MTTVRARIDLPVAPAAVWEVIMDPARFADWVTIHRALHHADPGPPRPGWEVEQTLALAGAPFTVRWRLAESEPPFHGVWEGVGPVGARARIVNALTPLSGGSATRYDYLNEYSNPGGRLGRFAGRVLVRAIAEREANRSLERLRAVLAGSQ